MSYLASRFVGLPNQLKATVMTDAEKLVGSMHRFLYVLYTYVVFKEELPRMYQSAAVFFFFFYGRTSTTASSSSPGSIS